MVECETFVDDAVKRSDDYKAPLLKRHQKHSITVPCSSVVEHERTVGKHAENKNQVCAWVGIISPEACQCVDASNSGELKRAVSEALVK